jgi:hypothetical protein
LTDSVLRRNCITYSSWTDEIYNFGKTIKVKAELLEGDVIRVCYDTMKKSVSWYIDDDLLYDIKVGNRLGKEIYFYFSMSVLENSIRIL